MVNETRGDASIDLQRALLDPGSVFTSPRDVLQRDELSREQKIEILRRWEYDAAECAVALEEGMRGPESDLQRQVLLALEQLHADVDTERVGPTKQHGLLL
jgi:hypothetical protein